MLSHVQLFVTPWTVSFQALLAVGFSRAAMSRHSLLQGIFKTQELNLPLLKLAGGFFTIAPPGNPIIVAVVCVVQLLNCVQLCYSSAACQASLSFTISWSLCKLISIESVMPFNHLILCHPLVLLLSIFPSIRVFSSGESALHNRWPKYWTFSSKPSNEYSGLISLRIGWFDLLLSREFYKSKK